MRTHLHIPDTQIRKGVPIHHIDWAAHYALDKGPNVVMLAGDWYDFPSLSLYDKRGSLATELRRLQVDIDSARRPLESMLDLWDRRGWVPEIHLTLGNHEQRYYKMVNAEPHLMVGRPDPFDWLRERGVKVHPFLKKVTIDGVCYSHFHPENAKGQITQTKNGAPSAREQVKRLMMSSTAGHQQGIDWAVVPTPRGLQRGLIAGSFYLHNEEYLGPDNRYWRGMILKQNVKNGEYTINEIDMPYLERKYGRLCPRRCA